MYNVCSAKERNLNACMLCSLQSVKIHKAVDTASQAFLLWKDIFNFFTRPAHFLFYLITLSGILLKRSKILAFASSPVGFPRALRTDNAVCSNLSWSLKLISLALTLLALEIQKTRSPLFLFCWFLVLYLLKFHCTGVDLNI